MKVTVFGTGYVGLVQGAALAEVGHEVCCVDVDPAKVAALEEGIIPIYEPGLDRLVQENTAAGRLSFSTDAAHGVAHGRVIFIAVGTPPGPDGGADLTYVQSVAESVATHMEAPRLVINKSTVPVGTETAVRAKLAETLEARGRADLDFDVVSNPEFLKEGSAVADCMRPDRIIVGVTRKDSEALLRELFAPFNRNHEKMIVMDPRSAELTKYAANCMLATKISFMNEMAAIADRLDCDIEAVRQGIGSDPRIGYHFIYAGAGYGGSCFPKDVKALIHTARAAGCEPHVLRAVEDRNADAKTVIFEKMQAHFGARVGEDGLKGKTIALWGLAFKPNTDDMREASARVLMEALWQAGATVQAYDPQAMEETQKIYGTRDDLRLCGTKEAALSGADALVVLTEWRVFQSPDFEAIREALSEPVLFDGRNLYDPERMQDYGFTHYGIGRGMRPAQRPVQGPASVSDVAHKISI